MKRGNYVGIGILIALFILPLVPAEIFVGQPEASVYNIGDVFRMNMSLISTMKKTDFVSAALVCGNQAKEIYRSIHTVLASEQKSISLELGLDPSLLGDLKGNCFLETMYGDERGKSREFEISSRVEVTMEINGVAFGPQETVNISGTALKANGQPLKGFVVLNINGINVSVQGIVQEGGFAFSFLVPDNAVPGSYTSEVEVYEKNEQNEIINSGKASQVLRIRQVLRGILIHLTNQSIMPGNSFAYNVIIFDQSGGNVLSDVEVEISSPDKSTYLKKLVKSGSENSLPLAANITPGYWTIKSKIEGLEESKQFLVDESEEALFILENDTLLIKNIGNVRYQKPIEISIGGNSEVTNPDLGIGESKQYKLGAPNGEYAISISDGKKQQDLGSTFLTGRAIGISEIGSAFFGDGISTTWIWILLIAILGVVLLILLKKVLKKRFIGKTPKIIIPFKKSSLPEGIQVKKEPIVAAVGAVDKGVKQEGTIIALKIKNLPALQRVISHEYSPLEDVEKALLEAKSAGAKIYVDQEYRVMIFVPLSTQQKDNEMRALIVAKEIESILKGHNKFSPQKIDFGIGVHVGEMVVESQAGKMKFASLGNTIGTAKKTAEQSKEEVLLSEGVHRKVLGKVKVDKVAGTSSWRLKQVLDREHYDVFIQRFLKRQMDEKKKG